jgi:hypothetical protein
VVTASASPSILNLLGLSSTLTASGAANYQWSTGASGSAIVVIPLTTSTYTVIGTDVHGCTGTASATVTIKLLGGLGLRTSSDGATGIAIPTDKEEPVYEIASYPNPSNGIFYVRNAPKNAIVEVHSIIGEKVFSKDVQEEVEEIDLGSRSTGIYILRVNHKGLVIHHEKIIRR